MNKLRKAKNGSVTILQGLTFFLEDLLAWGVLLALLYHGWARLSRYLADPSAISTSTGFRNLLADALLIAMGAEFVRTFLEHTPETVVEVLTFAIARHMVIDKLSMLEILAGCAAVLLLIGGQYFVSDKRAQHALKLAKMQKKSNIETDGGPVCVPLQEEDAALSH
ncbi:MAG: hypothetical protein MSH10_02135 [Pygmaiobacter massiliensis]|nr:hypothetical protein [Pygmaiobacter massiliensis]